MSFSDTKFWFDEAAASRVVNFFSKYLRHTKGRWAGSPFELQDWQRDDIIRPLFGWRRRDGTRRYRTAYIEIPRKNGKSTLCAGIGLYLLFGDNEPGAEIYSAAADRDQAAIVFEQARSMVEKSPSLLKRCKMYKRSISIPKLGSVYRVLSAEAFTKHGLNAHGIIFDELHAQPHRDLWDVLNTSTGARSQPMMVQITTAGYNRESICWEQHEYARQILEALLEDDSYFAYIAAAGPDDSWTDSATWRRANPGYDITVSAEYLAQECARAEQVPAYQNTFRRLHLNQWTSQESRWLDMRAWDVCSGPHNWDALPAHLHGREAYGGLDLAKTTDIAAWVLVFPPQDDGLWYVLPRFFIPREGLIERSKRDRVPYDAWVRGGLVLATDGNVIDYDYIQAQIKADGHNYVIKEIAFDRWGATLMSQKLDELGFTMVEFGQGFASMSAPTKELLRLILQREIAHGAHPVLRWMADNVVTREDAAGNIKPDKAKSRQKIDGVVALIMGLDRAVRHFQPPPPPSVYESRGLVIL